MILAIFKKVKKISFIENFNKFSENPLKIFFLYVTGLNKHNLKREFQKKIDFILFKF